MYKLLLATNDPAVVEAFSAVKWEELGFKQPRVVSTAEEALRTSSAGVLPRTKMMQCISSISAVRMTCWLSSCWRKIRCCRLWRSARSPA